MESPTQHERGRGPLLAAAALAVLAVAAGTAAAQQAPAAAPETMPHGSAMPPGAIPPEAVERIAFEAADTNDDGVVDEAELTRDAARGFATLDKDGSRTLTPDELGPHDPALFRRVDANGDGKLTFKEVMTNKVRALKAGDKDGDGALSFEEMVQSVEAETGGAS